MSFLSPEFLFGLLGVGIPIAIHLLRREKAVRIPFSTVRFLKNAPKESAFTHRFQQWLLMLMRVAIMALMAVAFARPLISSKPSEWIGPVPESAVILLDTSMSMGYGDHFDQAKKRAMSILSRINQAAIITFSDGIDQIKELTTDKTELKRFLDTIHSPGYRTTRFLPALRLADQILEAARYPNKTVYLISDFQHHGFSLRDERWRLSPGVRFKGFTVADKETSNLAITQVNAPHRLVQDREEHTIRAHVRNLGTRPIPATQMSLRINGKIVATQQVDLSDQSEGEASVEVRFPVTFRNRGTHLGVISVKGDPLTADNHYYFTTRGLPPVRVLCITPTASRNWHEDDSYWFRTALGKSERSTFEITVVQPRQFNPAEWDAYDVIVMLNIGELEPPQLEGLQKTIERGGHLLLAPADRVNQRTFNRQFGNLSPAELGQKAVRSGPDFLAITAFDARHPIFKSLGPIDFTKARFREYWPTTPIKDSTVLMGLEGGIPVLLERSVGKGRVLLFASSLDLKWNNLAVQSIYLPMLHETLNYLAGLENRKFAYRIGEPIPMSKSDGKLIGIIDPQGRDVGGFFKRGAHPFFTNARLPGFYAIRTTNHKEPVAVNPPVLESDLTPMEPAFIRQMITNTDPKPKHASEAAGTVFNMEIEKKQHLWWWLLLLVFILALGETRLANRTYR
jgi:hypothetical protein